jgi:hypothetical protein
VIVISLALMDMTVECNLKGVVAVLNLSMVKVSMQCDGDNRHAVDSPQK